MTTQTLRRRTMRRVAAASATSVLLVGLTACSSDEGSTAADESAADESSQTTDEPAEESANEPEAVDVAAGEEVPTDEFIAMYQAGIESLTTAAITTSTSGSGVEIEAKGDIDYTQTPAAMSMTMEMGALGDSPLDVRLVDGTFYMNLGAVSQNKFIKFDLDDKNSPLADMGALSDSMDPVKAFEQFADGVDKVVYVGEEEVDGESLDRYELTVDTTKIEGMDAVEGAGDLPESVTYDMWLDDENRMRQVDADVMSVETSTTISDFGKDVDIKAPSASEITKLPGT